MINKNGKIKLEKGDIRVGNFVLSVESQHIKVQDLNKFFTLRINKRMPVGIWLDNMVNMARADENAVNSLKTYIAVLWSVLSVVPDNEYMQDLIKAAQAGLARHPDWYGKKENGDGQEVPDDGQE